MNFGEIRVLRFESPKCGAKTIPADLWINSSAELIVVYERRPVILDVFGEHSGYQEILLSGVIARPPAARRCPTKTVRSGGEARCRPGGQASPRDSRCRTGCRSDRSDALILLGLFRQRAICRSLKSVIADPLPQTPLFHPPRQAQQRARARMGKGIQNH